MQNDVSSWDCQDYVLDVMDELEDGTPGRVGEWSSTRGKLRRRHERDLTCTSRSHHEAPSSDLPPPVNFDHNMDDSLSPELFAALRQGPVEARTRELKHIKDILIGHDHRKEAAVHYGILDVLAHALSSPKATSKRRVDGFPTLAQPPSWTPEDEWQLQAAIVTTSLAAGGQAFLEPMCAAGIPKVLMTALCTGQPAPKFATAVLQALRALASLSPTHRGDAVGHDFWPVIVTPQSLDVFNTILMRPSAANDHQLQLVSDLIAMFPETCNALAVQSGILDTLAALLIAHSIEHRLLGSHAYPSNTKTTPSTLSPPPRAAVPPVLGAVSNLVAGSRYRTHCFILSQPIRDALMHTAVDQYMPQLHVPATKTISYSPTSNHFPAMNTLTSNKHGGIQQNRHNAPFDIGHANAVCQWLIVLVRSMRGSDRLAALTLLGFVTAAIDTEPMETANRTEWQQKTRERERQLALLAIPLAVALVQLANENKGPCVQRSAETRRILEDACAVLALLTKRNKQLQVAAVEAGAVKLICPVLKRSFDNIPLAKPIWNAQSRGSLPRDVPPSRTLGPRAFPPEILHVMQCRKSALEALAALAAQEDLHRKAIIDAGAVSFIIDSLRPFPPGAVAEAMTNRTPISPKDGNTVPVVLAACHAARSMSRSVTILRTSLIDGGLAKPIIQLLQHPDMEVLVAATDVCCNLALEFSPLRDDLIETDVVKTLVAHAKSSTPALRLSSLWTLKHLMCTCSKDLKISTLEELGTGWLIGVIQGAPKDMTAASGHGGVSVGLSSANAAGEQIDLLNPSSMDIDHPGGLTNARLDDDHDDDGEVLYDEASSTHYQSSQLRSTLNQPTPVFNSKRFLSTVWNMEYNEEYIVKRDETIIQVQAMDLLRNLMNGEDCATLSDHIMTQIGNAKVYDILTAKLSPLVRPAAGGSMVYYPTEVVLSTIHILIHLANASPKHRSMLIAQKPLLAAMLPHFNHLDHQVRTMMVWAVTSLTHVEDEDDRREARQRSNELKAAGIEQAVRAMANDPVLDIRERVKTAVRHFEKLA